MPSPLTHRGWDKMVAISQTMFPNSFSWMKMSEFRIICRWNVFSGSNWQYTLVAYGSGKRMVTARDRGSKQETLNDDFYHTTSCSAAIFGIQTVLSYLVLALNLWIGLCSMKRSSGVWSFGDVSVTYGSRNTMFRYRTSEVPVPNQKLR